MEFSHSLVRFLNSMLILYIARQLPNFGNGTGKDFFCIWHILLQKLINISSKRSAFVRMSLRTGEYSVSFRPRVSKTTVFETVTARHPALRVPGIESARKALDPSLPANALIQRKKPPIG
jgi:hypothetical protein